MEGDAAGAAVAVLVQNLINVSKEEISLIRGLEKNADKLEGTLATIQTSLDDAQKKFINDEAVGRWLKELEAVAFDADNALDELDYKLLSKKMKAIREKKKSESSCFPSFNKYVQRRKMALTINEINTKFESIDERATKLGLERRLADAPAAPDIAALETDSFTADPIFIGRDDDVSKIVEMLTNPTEEGVSVLPIVGMGGLGKTTLVRNVFNHQKTKANFGLRIWVHVSQNFDAVILLKKILTNLNGGNVEGETKEAILKKLQEALGAKTFLLILDDVWNQDRQKWEGFINSWSGITSTKGNGILVTTRNTEVGSIVNTIGIHHLNGLSEEECWSIIKDRALKGRDIPPGFEAIGRSVARRCQGLPLAANVVGGVLREKSQDEWLLIKENWLSDAGGDENNISRILRLSYDHLSSPSLKKCFAYCSFFPKGAQIESKYLVELWMAEGFLQPSPTSDMENVGNKFVDKLVQSSLLQVVDRDEFNNIKDCSMHDLVHDVAASMLGFPTSNGLDQARYIYWESEGCSSRRIPKEQTKWLRTLSYKANIWGILFLDFKSLHVLILSGNVRELPHSIGDLIHLRLLNVSFTVIKEMPDSIGELYHLQTCRARVFGLLWLPNTFKYLLNLRHLDLRNDTFSPPHLGMLTSLQTLSCFNVADKEGSRIVELGSLKNLKGKLEIINLDDVLGEDESNNACLSQKSGILRLILRWDRFREGGINDENVLKGLQPHPNLKALEISGFNGASFPSWTLKMEGLNNLMEINLESCAECEEIPAMGHLPLLKSVYLSNLKNVKSINSSFYNTNGSSNDVFPALEKLKLFDMPNLREWVEVEIPSGAAQVKIFPRLEYLEIHNCNQLRSAPSIFPCLKVLRIEEMVSGVPLASICGVRLTSLVELKISKVREMEYLPDLLFHNNHDLSVLLIEFIDNLRELPDGLQTLTSLRKLTISYCDNLESIQFSSVKPSQGLTSLCSLTISSNTGINVPSEMVESCASSLEELTLSGIVTNMPTVIEHMHEMHRLAVWDIENIPKFIISSSSSSPTELGSLRSLKTLTIRADDSWDWVSFNKAVSGILRLGSQSIQTLKLVGGEDWESPPIGDEDCESLPGQLQHLTALSKIYLSKFGIEELPEWFGNLPSLKEVHLYRCKKMKSQPFVQVMLRLPKLSKLDISDCPLLK